ncbi:hypothetical protein C3941_09100 [Kaistia algarum]|uniref:hypothetical protein n=1 Tax=Kaistia algarum TaxID=2083279 RepID=UPI000CE8B80C|nr:hypothetical protein [Kaistia algarum]MCX5512217.1 hypothetical protein [Kaistia algarum]PPE80311.1 hypothetical protein C3941_09100 [Kaistia algarum]
MSVRCGDRRASLSAIGAGAIALLGATLMTGGAAVAQSGDPVIALELNDAAANAKACRLSFVIANKQTIDIDDMALELVLFDKDGRVERFVVVRSGKVPAAKNRVRQFDIAETACADIGRVLLNDVKECKGDGLTPPLCSDRIQASSRAAIGFEN